MRIVFDLEIYQNYFLATFVYEDGRVIEFERFNDQDSTSLRDIGRLIHQHTLISFNGKRYDMPLLSLAMTNVDNATLKEASDKVIKNNAMWWHLEKHYNFMTLELDHIDIINLLPLYESLKLYGARAGTAKLQDLPYVETSIVTDKMAEVLRFYCRNDCQLTWELFVGLWPQIQLREKMGITYKQDLRSKSDAQIAEAVMKSEFQNITGTQLIKPIDAGSLPDSVDYKAPEWVRFNRVGLRELVRCLEYESYFEGFKLHPTNGKPIAPDWLKGKTVTIGGRKYAVGLGGLHAKNKHESHYSTPGKQLIDLDVTSYYPAIILNNGYAPPHMGDAFTQIYESLVKQRLEAKAAGDKVAAEALKITINGTYGKLGSRFSAVYAPELLLSVTFTGQLALLMLIEMMAERDIQCVSANTDGVIIVVEEDHVIGFIEDRYTSVVDEWGKITGFTLEETRYKSIHYRDVNNYFALTNEGELKTKGVFLKPGIKKNPAAPIVFQAVIAYVLYGKSVDDTIFDCADIHQFLSVRTVRGGAAKDGEYLGKAVRWYYSTDTDTAIHYISNGNKVAKTDGAMPMMDIGLIPDDLDVEWYIDEAHKTIDEVGYESWL